MVVHHVEMQNVRTRSKYGRDVFAEPREVGRQ
jgi:hypothetical protein